MEEVIIVQPIPNMRLIVDENSDLTFQSDRETVIRSRDLKSNFIKKLLIEGKLKVKSGVAEFDYKGEHFKFEKEK